jgi:hypothetical protein
MVTAGAVAGHADVSVTETNSRVTVENESIKVAFDARAHYALCELVDKRVSGHNLIVDNFCLYYQYIEAGAIRSVNEGSADGRVINGRHEVEKKDGQVTVEFRGDTPHFHLARRVTVPATGPVIKIVYELEATTTDSFGFSLPYAPLSPKLNKVATHAELFDATGATAGRVIVEDAGTPTLHTGSPYNRAECHFDERTGAGLVFAHVPEECAAGISRCATPRFAVGARERCTFVVVPFQGDYEAALASYVRPKTTGPDPSSSSSAVVLKRAPEWVLWADHATRKVFPQEAPPPTAPQAAEVAIEAARGEYEPFQVVLTPQTDLDDVKLALGPLVDEKGNQLAAENVRSNPIGGLRSSYNEDIPDLLLQQEAVRCERGKNAVFWVTVKVPPTTPAGTYRGTAALTSGGRALAAVNVRLKVWGFALAATPHIGAFATDYVYLDCHRFNEFLLD